jgi:mannosyltransferase
MPHPSARSQATAPSSAAALLLLAPLLAAIAGLWLPGLRTSLGIDEAVTSWVIRAGARETFRRAMHYQSSPVAFFLPWASAAVLGTTELALRLPSLLAMLAATLFLAGIAARLWDREAGALAAIVFATEPLIVFQAGNARPYALGLATLTGGLWLLLRWLDTDRRRDAIGAALLSSLTAHVHPLLGLALVVHVVVLLRAVRAHRLTLPKATAILGLMGLFLIPLAVELRSLAERRTALSYAPVPTFSDLFALIAPPEAVGAVALALLVGVLIGGRMIAAGVRSDRDAAGLALSWLTLPALLLFAISRLTPLRLLTPHYAIAGTPALALVLGGALRLLATAPARVAAAVTVVALSLAAHLRDPDPQRAWRQDWRAAAAVVRAEANPGTPVLMISGLVEANQPEWLADTEKASYLTCPFAMYPVPGRLVPLPWRSDTPALSAYVARVVDDVRGSERFLFVARGDAGMVEQFLLRELAPQGFRARRALGTEGLVVSVFERGS